MAPEVKEVDIDLSEANATSDQIYQQQLENFPPEFRPYSPETVEISEKALAEDIALRRQKLEDERAKIVAEQGIGEADAQRLQEVVPQPPAALDPSIDQAPEQAPQEEKKPEKSPQEILAELGLKHEPKQRTVSDANGNERTYLQKPLSFVGKIQFLSYIGEVLDKAMSGENSLKLNSLFDVPTRGDVLSAQDFSDAQTFVQAVGKLLVYAPDFLSKSYCIWLRIPEYERDWAIATFEENLSDEEGFDIIETFIDQNWETLQGFFIEKLPSLSKRLQARYRASQSEQ